MPLLKWKSPEGQYRFITCPSTLVSYNLSWNKSLFSHECFPVQTAKTIYESLLGENARVTSLGHIQVSWHYFLCTYVQLMSGERVAINFVLRFPTVVYSVSKEN